MALIFYGNFPGEDALFDLLDVLIVYVVDMVILIRALLTSLLPL